MLAMPSPLHLDRGTDSPSRRTSRCRTHPLQDQYLLIFGHRVRARCFVLTLEDANRVLFGDTTHMFSSTFLWLVYGARVRCHYICSRERSRCSAQTFLLAALRRSSPRSLYVHTLNENVVRLSQKLPAQFGLETVHPSLLLIGRTQHRHVGTRTPRHTCPLQ